MIWPYCIAAGAGVAGGFLNFLITRSWMRAGGRMKGAFLIFLAHLAVTAAMLAVIWGGCRLFAADPLIPFAAEVLVQTVVSIICITVSRRGSREP